MRDDGLPDRGASNASRRSVRRGRVRVRLPSRGDGILGRGPGGLGGNGLLGGAHDRFFDRLDHDGGVLFAYVHGTTPSVDSPSVLRRPTLTSYPDGLPPYPRRGQITLGPGRLAARLGSCRKVGGPP